MEIITGTKMNLGCCCRKANVIPVYATTRPYSFQLLCASLSQHFGSYFGPYDLRAPTVEDPEHQLPDSENVTYKE